MIYARVKNITKFLNIVDLIVIFDYSLFLNLKLWDF